MNSIFKAILEENAITDKKMKKGLKRFIKYGMKLKQYLKTIIFIGTLFSRKSSIFSEISKTTTITTKIEIPKKNVFKNFPIIYLSTLCMINKLES